MKDLLACSLVCLQTSCIIFTLIAIQVAKHFRKVIVESSRLQYIIELARHCAVSLLPSASSVPFSTRLKRIRERERGWKYLDWKRKHTLKLPPTGSVYEFVGGLYANGRENLSRITASISFLELPSTGHEPDTPLQTWTHAMEDINIIDFTMDPSQDLLVLVALAPAESVLNLGLICTSDIILTGRHSCMSFTSAQSKPMDPIPTPPYPFFHVGRNLLQHSRRQTSLQQSEFRYQGALWPF